MNAGIWAWQGHIEAIFCASRIATPGFLFLKVSIIAEISLIVLSSVSGVRAARVDRPFLPAARFARPNQVQRGHGKSC